MRKEILDKMQEQINDNRFCKWDFECDEKALANTNEPFVWMVREQGTSLACVGNSVALELMENTALRMSLFRDTFATLKSFSYYSGYGNVKYFYYDGVSLVQLPDYKAVQKLYENLLGGVIEKLKEQYPDEVRVCNNGIDFRVIDESCGNKWHEAVMYAQELETTSLVDCMNNLKSHARYAVQHYVMIYPDSLPYSFGFNEIIDGKVSCRGGIIFHEYSQKWQIHT